MLDATQVTKEYYDYKMSLSHSARSAMTRASDLGHPCTAYIAFTRVAGEQAQRPDAKLSCIFSEGRLQEHGVITDLMAMGYSVVRGQRAVYWDRYEISGHIDGYLTKLGGDEVLIEVKSCSPFAFVRFQTIEDVKNAKKYYYRKWVHQLNIYQLLEPAEEAWLVLKNKATGELRILPHPLDYQLGEETLKKAELVKNMVDAARGQELPEGWLKPNRLNDAEICLECPFKAICCPEIDAGVGILFSEDGEMAEALKHWESTAQASEEHEELDKGIKAKAKFCFDAGSKEILCGEFVIKGTKIEPKGKQPYWKTEINRIAPGSTAE